MAQSSWELELPRPEFPPSRPSVYVIEDEQDISRLIAHNLTTAGFDVSVFGSAVSVVARAQQQPPSVFLVDIMLPGPSGLELCKEIRTSRALQNIPVIFLTARNDEIDRIRGFEVGADDYLAKPFSPRELVARVRAVLRPSVPSHTSVMQFADLEIDPESMTVRVRGNTVFTTVREFRILEFLANHSGRVFTRDQILNAVCEEALFITPRSVDVYVRRLREKIEDDPRLPRYIKTLRGFGYRFDSPRR